MRDLVEALCSDACAGRATGTPGGRLARSAVIDALRAAGLDPFEQDVPASAGTNVVATLPGDIDRWVLVAAHYDHLGVMDGDVYRGADDNAAAVAILVETARALAKSRAQGRGVIIAAFDAEEPPHFLTAGMGSQHFAEEPPVPLDRIDLMVCMDLVGHALGDDAPLPAHVRDTMFALGAERSDGTTASVLALGRKEQGVVVRAADADIVPKLSDYAAFWARERPFLFLTNGRTRRYHTPDDTIAHLDWHKMSATARWLERFVRATCARDERFVFRDRRDDLVTLDSLLDLLAPLAELSPRAEQAHALARSLRQRVRTDRTLDLEGQEQLAMLVIGVERALE